MKNKEDVEEEEEEEEIKAFHGPNQWPATGKDQRKKKRFIKSIN